MAFSFHPHQPGESGMVPWFWLVGIPVTIVAIVAVAWPRHGEGRETPTLPVPIQAWQVRFINVAPASQTAGFAGTYRPGELLFVPPGSLFACAPQPPEAQGQWSAVESAWAAEGGRLDEKDCLCAPQRPGLYHLVWNPAPSPEPSDGQRKVLNVLVLTKADQETSGSRTDVRVLNQNIGSYSDPKESKLEKIVQYAQRYQPPEYFAVLDSQTLSLKVGRNLEFGQLVAFIDRRGTDGRKIYTQTRHTNVLPPSRALCEKLSLLMERLQSQGVKVTRFWITSGFRTPTYNRSIGGATYSRHCYGDAVDLVIDEDGNRRMDDLNGDGRVDRLDGLVIAKACQALEREGLTAVGGIGVYEWDADDSVRSHVHIDCRGYPARWGQMASGRKKLNYDWWSDLEGKDLDGSD